MEIVTNPKLCSWTITNTDVPKMRNDVHLMINKFIALHKELCQHKDLLNPYEKDKKYFTFSRNIFPYNELKYILKKDYNIPHVTNAWLKTYELLNYISARVPETGTYKIFFNANAPGASTLAAQYFFKVAKPNTEMDWVASTYLGDDTLEDSYGLIKNYRDKWLMDESNNGDVTVVNNILNFKQKLEDKVDLYFSDIAINIGNDYNNEEELEIKEVFGQNISGLVTLKIGGTMIVKQRSFTLPFNIWMIHFMSQCFETFEIVKPATSRSYNSEVYLVGMNYTGIDDEEAADLLYKLMNFGKHIAYKIHGRMDISVVRKIYEAAKEVSDKQMKAIRYCTNIYELHKTLPPHIKCNLSYARRKFIIDHDIRKLPIEEYL